LPDQAGQRSSQFDYVLTCAACYFQGIAAAGRMLTNNPDYVANISFGSRRMQLPQACFVNNTCSRWEFLPQYQFKSTTTYQG
jgi:hypothetical protein